MSTRALQKLYGDKSKDLLGGAVADDTEHAESVNFQSGSDLEDDPMANASVKKKGKKKKNKKTAEYVGNPFDLLGDEDNIEDDIEEDQSSKPESTEHKVTVSATKKKNKKKKKKSKGAKEANKDEEKEEEEEDEIDASLREVNRLLGELPTASNTTFDSEGNVTAAMKALLGVEHRNLNPDNEMKRIFGSRVVQADQRRRRNPHRTTQKNTWLSRPKDNWPPATRSGLSMTLLDSSHGCQYFTFEHCRQYQKVQFDFLDAVESLDHQNIINLVHLHPSHIDGLLQVSEICRMGDDTQTAAEFIERALYTCESCFHPRFSLTQGTCRLDYKRPENRGFFIALFRQAVFVGMKGCYRTALELCKLILSFDMDGDPLCILLMLDFYALKAEQFELLIRMHEEWENHRNLSQMPNFAFSLALAMFAQASDNSTETESADKKLQDALLMFPGLLVPLLDKCGITADGRVLTHPFFNAHIIEAAALKQLSALYVGRCHACWKAPEVISWLETNVQKVLDLVDRGDDTRVEEYKARRETRYKCTPRNIHRHILMSEVKEALSSLPPEVTNGVVVTWDPLPPSNSIISYTRPARPRQAEQDQNALSLFFRSLLPNFNPNEIVEEEQGAGGGADLRQGVATLMDTMRDLLNNIQPAAAPREDEENIPDEEFD